ncbi:hypothetical protein [uncultured Legionella sp.]|uniref:hypothetical protein n=1 Tax=uncultured Legionella sp. TaxID=210934 RepID=UPI002626A70D|nr:hypothetical protein [uncultured Legionella sp.]
MQAKNKEKSVKAMDANHPSINPFITTPNHMAFSAQLLYPYWGSYVRNTLIHFFRADETSPWTIIAHS